MRMPALAHLDEAMSNNAWNMKPPRKPRPRFASPEEVEQAIDAKLADLARREKEADDLERRAALTPINSILRDQSATANRSAVRTKNELRVLKKKLAEIRTGLLFGEDQSIPK
jgi:hypothetical protein